MHELADPAKYDTLIETANARRQRLGLLGSTGSANASGASANANGSIEESDGKRPGMYFLYFLVYIV